MTRNRNDPLPSSHASNHKARNAEYILVLQHTPRGWRVNESTNDWNDNWTDCKSHPVIQYKMIKLSQTQGSLSLTTVHGWQFRIHTGKEKGPLNLWTSFELLPERPSLQQGEGSVWFHPELWGIYLKGPWQKTAVGLTPLLLNYLICGTEQKWPQL